QAFKHLLSVVKHCPGIFSRSWHVMPSYELGIQPRQLGNDPCGSVVNLNRRPLEAREQHFVLGGHDHEGCPGIGSVEQIPSSSPAILMAAVLVASCMKHQCKEPCGSATTIAFRC